MNNLEINKKVLNFTFAMLQSHLNLNESADIAFNSFIISLNDLNVDEQLNEIEFIYNSIGFHNLDANDNLNKLLSIYQGLKDNDNSQIDRLSMLINR